MIQTEVAGAAAATSAGRAATATDSSKTPPAPVGAIDLSTGAII